ncbi:MAG TPA: TetR/AcrR family transcriptional regulator C-terminal domain-containing protein [Chloroflexota bacterium]
MAKAREIATQFPRLRTRLDTTAAEYGAAPENTFEFGLQAILDGLEAQLIAGRTPANRNERKPARHQHEPRATSPTKS